MLSWRQPRGLINPAVGGSAAAEAGPIRWYWFGRPSQQECTEHRSRPGRQLPGMGIIELKGAPLLRATTIVTLESGQGTGTFRAFRGHG